MSLNEVGIQTAETGRARLHRDRGQRERRRRRDRRTYATEAYQASWYVADARTCVACDPNVRLVNIYHLIDESDLAGWQSGLYDVNRNAEAVGRRPCTTGSRAAAARCQGALQPWTPTGVPAAPAASPPVAAKESTQRILVASDGRIRIFDARQLPPATGARAVRHGLHRAALGRARRRATA